MYHDWKKKKIEEMQHKYVLPYLKYTQGATYLIKVWLHAPTEVDWILSDANNFYKLKIQYCHFFLRLKIMQTAAEHFLCVFYRNLQNTSGIGTKSTIWCVTRMPGK